MLKLMELSREIPLDNGLKVSFYHHIHRYFGDYHRINVDIICEVPLLEKYFTTKEEFTEARAILGRNAVFRRHLELMGVSSAKVEQSLENVIANFSRYSLTYLSSSLFPRKLVLAEVYGARQKTSRAYTGS
jgi:hypothetical protein